MSRASRKAFFARRQEIAERMYRHGFTFRQIASAFGTDSGHVARQFAANGVSVRHGSEAVKIQWVGADSRRRTTSEKMRQTVTGNTFQLGRPRPDAAERMRRNNPTRDPEVRRRMSESAKGRYAGTKNPMYGRPAPNGGKSGYKHGRRADLGPTYFRSTWEANIARIYNRQGTRWQFEPKAFELSGGRTYRPDFYLPESDTWVEIKGMWRPDARAKFDDFRREYPDLRVLLVDADHYDGLRQRWCAAIPEWEA